MSKNLDGIARVMVAFHDRRAFLSILPIVVLGISSHNIIDAGTLYLARFLEQWSFNSCSDAVVSGFNVTHALMISP